MGTARASSCGCLGSTCLSGRNCSPWLFFTSAGRCRKPKKRRSPLINFQEGANGMRANYRAARAQVDRTRVQGQAWRRLRRSGRSCRLAQVFSRHGYASRSGTGSRRRRTGQDFCGVRRHGKEEQSPLEGPPKQPVVLNYVLFHFSTFPLLPLTPPHRPQRAAGRSRTTASFGTSYCARHPARRPCARCCPAARLTPAGCTDARNRPVHRAAAESAR